MFYCINGKVIKFNVDEFNNETEKYYKLWKLKYNIELPKKYISEKNMIDFICGKKNSL